MGLGNLLAGGAPVDNGRGAAAGGLQYRHAEGFLPAGTHIQVRRSVALCQLLLVCRPGQGQDGPGQGFGLGPVNAHQNELAVRRQQSAEGHEIGKTLSGLPHISGAQENEFVFQTPLLPKVAGNGVENGGIHFVGHHGYGIVFQKAFLYQTGQPPGGNLKGEVGNAGKEVFFLLVVPGGGIQHGFGIEPLLGAAAAAGFPVVTAHKAEIGAVAGKRPAVVKGPAELLAAGAQIVKQQPHMEIIPMKVVQPDHIGVIFPDLLQKVPGSPGGTKAAGAEDPVPDCVELIVHRSADGHGLDAPAVPLGPAIGDAAGMPGGFQLPGGLHNDFPGAAHPGHYVDEEIFHALGSFSGSPSRERKRLTYFSVQISGV